MFEKKKNRKKWKEVLMHLYAFYVECIPWSNWEKSVVVPLSSFIILSRNVFFYHCTVIKMAIVTTQVLFSIH